MNVKCDGKTHLGLGYICITVLTEECFPGKPCSQEETNSSTSKFWLSSAVLSVDLLWLNEEKRRGINFLTSGTRVPAGLCCAACGGCNIFNVFCLLATAGTACWLLTTCGAIAAWQCWQSLRCTFLASIWSCNNIFSPPVPAAQEKFVDVFSHFCLNCARDKMAQIKLQSNFCSKNFS